jgi:uncharacterized membrane protein YhaH (DUF805 family)
MSVAYLFTAFDGRINRAPYWLATLVLVAVSAAIDLAAVYWSEGFGQPQSVATRAIVFILHLAILYPSAAVTVKRLHDRNYPASVAGVLIGLMLLAAMADLFNVTDRMLGAGPLGSALALAILAVMLVFLVELGFRHGTRGPNRFGPDPLASGHDPIAPRQA